MNNRRSSSYANGYRDYNILTVRLKNRVNGEDIEKHKEKR